MTTQPHLRVVGHGDLPQPLIPADVVMTDLPAFLFDIDEMTQSDWNTDATDTEWRVGITLYARSFRQKPCGSLPDEDRHLAAICGFGRDIDGFRRVRARALDGWQKCSDGRLYRVDVAKNVLTVWIERVLTRRSSALGNERRWGGEPGAFDIEDYERSLSAAMAALGQIDKQSPILRRLKARRGKSLEQPAVMIDPAGTPAGTATGSPKGSEAEAKPSQTSGQSPEPPEGDRVCEPEFALEGGEGEKPINEPDGWPPDALAQFKAGWPGTPVHGWGKTEAVLQRLDRSPPVPWATVLAALASYGAYGRSQGRRFKWRNPQTWLNDKGWTAPYATADASLGPAPPGEPRAGADPRAQRPTTGVPSAIAGIQAVLNRPSGGDHG